MDDLVELLLAKYPYLSINSMQIVIDSLAEWIAKGLESSASISWIFRDGSTVVFPLDREARKAYLEGSYPQLFTDKREEE